MFIFSCIISPGLNVVKLVTDKPLILTPPDFTKYLLADSDGEILRNTKKLGGVSIRDWLNLNTALVADQ